MKQELIDQWCEALTSGKYKQCKGALQNDTGYCCLGVLADIHPDVELVKLVDHDSMRFAKYGGETSNGILPYTFWMSMETGVYQQVFSSANDQGLTFDEIAIKIRKKVRVTE